MSRSTSSESILTTVPFDQAAVVELDDRRVDRVGERAFEVVEDDDGVLRGSGCALLRLGSSRPLLRRCVARSPRAARLGSGRRGRSRRVRRSRRLRPVPGPTLGILLCSRNEVRRSRLGARTSPLRRSSGAKATGLASRRKARDLSGRRPPPGVRRTVRNPITRRKEPENLRQRQHAGDLADEAQPAFGPRQTRHER